MKFRLSKAEIQSLSERGIRVDPSHDYTEDEAFELLERVRDLEVRYSQDYGKDEKLFFMYGDLADKMQRQIPE